MREREKREKKREISLFHLLVHSQMSSELGLAESKSQKLYANLPSEWQEAQIMVP